jgi:hypothetical protein
MWFIIGFAVATVLLTVASLYNSVYYWASPRVFKTVKIIFVGALLTSIVVALLHWTGGWDVDLCCW